MTSSRKYAVDVERRALKAGSVQVYSVKLRRPISFSAMARSRWSFASNAVLYDLHRSASETRLRLPHLLVCVAQPAKAGISSAIAVICRVFVCMIGLPIANHRRGPYAFLAHRSDNGAGSKGGEDAAWEHIPSVHVVRVKTLRVGKDLNVRVKPRQWPCVGVQCITPFIWGAAMKRSQSSSERIFLAVRRS